MRLSDAQAGWRLVTVGARACTDAKLALELLQQPKLKNGKLWLRFMAWGTTVPLNENALCALKLLRQHFMRASFTAPKLIGIVQRMLGQMRRSLGWAAGLALQVTMVSSGIT